MYSVGILTRKLVEITGFSGFSLVHPTYTKRVLGKGLLLLPQSFELAILSVLTRCYTDNIIYVVISKAII